MKQEPTVVLTNRSTGKDYPMSESDAKAIMRNKNLANNYTKSSVAEVPEEVKQLRQENIEKPTVQAGNAKAATERTSPGNNTKEENKGL